MMWILLMPSTSRADQDKSADMPNKGQAKTIRGVVRDLYCPMQNLRATAHAFDVSCAVACLKAGSPMVIQTFDGGFYFPISDSAPDAEQRTRLMPFAGKAVEITGIVRSRNGVRVISVQQIRESKGTGAK
jgi:hypothetical protein